MEAIFIKVLNMSITAGWLVLAVILLRFILKKAPKWLMSVLWAFVAVRLVFPFSIESMFSLIPSTETLPNDILMTESPAVNSGIPYLNQTVNPIISESLSPDIGASVNPMQIIIFAASVVWIAGISTMLLYTLVSFLKIRKTVSEAVCLKENLWICDHIPSPFILGVIRPDIYLPSSMNQEDMEYVIAHEKAHLKRRDHWWKPLGFFLLTIHWFNPVLWVGYILFCRDIELACDEKVIKKMGIENKKIYSNILINCSIPRKMISACPLAFGEGSVKERVKNVLHYKKPAFKITLAAVAVIIMTAVCMLTDPADTTISTSGDADKITYEYFNSSGYDRAYVSLVPENKQFICSFSSLSSSCPGGTYEETRRTIILKADNRQDTYTFKKKGNNLIFDADKSSPVPSYTYTPYADAELSVPDGAVFKKASEEKICIDKVTFDIDGDGTEEDCVLDYGPTSGLFTFELRVSQDGTDEYFNIYNTEFYYLSFIEQDGTLKIHGVTQENPKEYIFDISIEDGNIVLSNNGENLPYWGEQGVDSKYK